MFINPRLIHNMGIPYSVRRMCFNVVSRIYTSHMKHIITWASSAWESSPTHLYGVAAFAESLDMTNTQTETHEPASAAVSVHVRQCDE